MNIVWSFQGFSPLLFDSDQQYTILEMSESEIFGVRKPIKAILLSQDKRNVPMEFRTLHADKHKGDNSYTAIK
jgi:hypothetical protein